MQSDTRYDDLVTEVKTCLRHSISLATAAGIPAERIAIDPGIGFGKNISGNLEIIRRLSEFTEFGHPVLLGPSRKSFIGKILGRELDDRVHGTAAVVAIAVANGASILRVHDVKEMRDVAVVAMTISRP